MSGAKKKLLKQQSSIMMLQHNKIIEILTLRTKIFHKLIRAHKTNDNIMIKSMNARLYLSGESSFEVDSG